MYAAQSLAEGPFRFQNFTAAPDSLSANDYDMTHLSDEISISIPQRHLQGLRSGALNRPCRRRCAKWVPLFSLP